MRSSQTVSFAVAVLGWGQGGIGPPNLAHAPQIFRVITVHKLLNTEQLDTVVLLVVASQMMRVQAPKYFSQNRPCSFDSAIMLVPIVGNLEYIAVCV